MQLKEKRYEKEEQRQGQTKGFNKKPNKFTSVKEKRTIQVRPTEVGTVEVQTNH